MTRLGSRHLVVALIVAAAVVALDLFSKAWLQSWLAAGERVIVTGFFQLVAVYNTGAAFSFLAQAGGWQRWLFLALALGVSAWLLWEAARTPDRWVAVACGAVVGGALGNAWDRWQHGAVFDFLLFHYREWAWPAFNLADTAITLGVLVLLWRLWQEEK